MIPMCTPDFMHSMGMSHPNDAMGMAAPAQAQGAAPQIGAPVTNQIAPQPGKPAVPANIHPAGTTGADLYAYGGGGPGGNIPGGPAVMAGGARASPAPTAAPTPPNPLDPLQQQNRTNNPYQPWRPYGAGMS